MAPVHSVRSPNHLSAMGMDFIDFLGGHRLAMVFKKLRQKKRNIKLLKNQHR